MPSCIGRRTSDVHLSRMQARTCSPLANLSCTTYINIAPMIDTLPISASKIRSRFCTVIVLPKIRSRSRSEIVLPRISITFRPAFSVSSPFGLPCRCHRHCYGNTISLRVRLLGQPHVTRNTSTHKINPSRLSRPSAALSTHTPTLRGPTGNVPQPL